MRFQKGDYVAHIDAFDGDMVDESHIIQITFINSYSFRFRSVSSNYRGPTNPIELLNLYEKVDYYKESPLYKVLNG